MKTGYLESERLLTALHLEAYQNVLFAHAHPDDETVLTGHAIHQLQRARLNVYTYIASDGTNSTIGDAYFVANGHRRSEADHALRELGVPPENQHYAGLHDGQLRAARELMSGHIGQIIATHDIDAVFTAGPAGFDGHDDHQAVHQAALAAADSNVALWALATQESADVTIAADAPIKLNALRWHASQFPVQAQKPFIFADGQKLLASERLMATHGSVEPRLWPYYDLLFFGEHYQRLGHSAAKYAILKKEETIHEAV